MKCCALFRLFFFSVLFCLLLLGARDTGPSVVAIVFVLLVGVSAVTVAVAAVAVVLGDIGHGDILNVLASDLGDRSCGEQLQMFFFIFLF